MCPSGTTPAPLSSSATDDFRQAFEALDADRDGKISRDDLRQFYPGKTDEDAIDSMISVADLNRNGFVEYDEFERVLGGRRSSGTAGIMEDVFKVMDKDGDGKLSHEDLRSYMVTAGFNVSDEDVTAMIKLGGGDENEGVTFDALIKILAIDNLVF